MLKDGVEALGSGDQRMPEEAGESGLEAGEASGLPGRGKNTWLECRV